MPRSITLPVTLVVVAMISIQTGASQAKSLFPLVGPVGTTALRLALAALLLCMVLRPWRSRLSPGARRLVLGYGLSVGTMNLLFYLSLKTIPLGIAVALEFTDPLALALFASRRLPDFLWVALAALGLWLLLPDTRAADHLDPLGVGLALATGVCWALYIVFGQKAGADHGAQTVAYGTLVAALLVLPIGLWQVGGELFAPQLLPVALAVAVLSSALPYSLEMFAMARMPARIFGILMSLEPAIAALAGLMLLGERLGTLQWLAVGAIVLASIGAAGIKSPAGER